MMERSSVALAFNPDRPIHDQTLEKENGQAQLSLCPEYFHSINIRDQKKIARILAAVISSPARSVGAKAKQNVISHFYSEKCGDVRFLESHTVERQFAIQLELDPSVKFYWTQVAWSGIQMTNAKGVRSPRTKTIDFLVLKESGLEIVECKAETWLMQRGQESGFRKENGEWANSELQNWANELGLGFRVWMAPKQNAVLLRNLEFLYSIVRQKQQLTSSVKKIVSAERNDPLTAGNLISKNPSISLIDVYAAIAFGSVFVPIATQRLDEPDTLRLYASKKQCDAVDLALQALLPETDNALHLEGSVLTASPGQIKFAEKRRQIFESVIARQIKCPWHLKKLFNEYLLAKQDGRPFFHLLMTSHHRSGNHGSRLLPETQAALTEYVRRYQKGDYAIKKDAFAAFCNFCESENIGAVGKTKFYNEIAAQSSAERAINTRGLRGFQAERPRTDSTVRSLPPIGFGERVHIDATPLDIKVCGESIFKDSDRPMIYIAIDAATEHPVGDAFIFGPARTDALAILMRSIATHIDGYPRSIFMDRGSEQTSKWIKTFAKNEGVALFWSPAGGARFNSLVESCHNKIRIAVINRLSGNMANDKAGRSADGRFKSDAALKHAFEVIVDETRIYLYEDLANAPDSNNRTPKQKKDEAVRLGLDCVMKRPMDAELMIKTSLAVTRSHIANERDALRLFGRRFTGTAMQRALRDEDLQELREDCANPAIAYAKVANTWYVCTSNQILLQQNWSDEAKLFDLLIRPERARRKALATQLLYLKRQKRLQERNAALLAASEVAPTVEKPASAKPETEKNTIEKGVREFRGYSESEWDQDLEGI